MTSNQMVWGIDAPLSLCGKHDDIAHGTLLAAGGHVDDLAAEVERRRAAAIQVEGEFRAFIQEQLLELGNARAGGISFPAAVNDDDDIVQRSELTDCRARLVVAVVTVHIEAVGQSHRFAVLHQHRSEFKCLPCIRLFELVGDKPLLAGSICQRGKVSVLIDNQQMMLGDVLAAQHLAVSDDDAVPR